MLNGAATAQTVSDGLVPTMAHVVSMRKCMMNADCCQLAVATCKILPEEVIHSSFGGVLTPDVEVFDFAGHW